MLQFSLFICHIFTLRFWSKQKIGHIELDRPAPLMFTTWWLKEQQMTTYGKKGDRHFGLPATCLHCLSHMWCEGLMLVLISTACEGRINMCQSGLLRAGELVSWWRGLATVDMTKWLTSRRNKSSYLTKKGLLREILGELMHLKPSHLHVRRRNCLR